MPPPDIFGQPYHFIQGFSRVMTDPRAESVGFQTLAGQAGSVWEVSRDGFWVGSGDVEASLVGSGRVGSDYPDPTRTARTGLTREKP